MDKKNTNELMDMLGLNETLEKMAIASGVRWFGHVLRRDEGDVLREALQFEVDGRRGRGRPRNTWKKQVEKEMKRAGLRREDAYDRGRWREGVQTIAMKNIRPPPLTGTKTGLKLE